MTHFMQLPNKTVALLDQELALKNGEITFEFGGTEKVLVTETALTNAIAGMSAPLTVATKVDLDALTNAEVETHQRILVTDDGDAKWAYYMITDITGAVPAYIKISDEDIFGALFSDEVTAQISKIGDLADLDAGMLNPATLIEGINTAYLQGVALNTRVGDNESLTTTETATVVGAINELDADLATEVTDRTNADTTLQGNIDTEATTRGNADTTLQGNIDTEATTRGNADTALQTELDDTQTGAGLGTDGTYTPDATTNYANTATSLMNADKLIDAQVKTNTDNIATEVTTRENADSALQTNINTEATTRANADTSIQTELNDTQLAAGLGEDGSYTADVATNYIQVATSLTDADKKIDAQLKITTDDLAQEVTDRTNADTTLQTNITNEATARSDADTALDTRVGDLELAVDGATGDLTTLTTDSKDTLVAAINEVDGNTNTNATAVTDIKTFINDMISKSGLTVASAALVANVESSFDISTLASNSVSVSIYSVSGAILSQEYGMFIDIDTTNNLVKITSSIDVTVKIVITADITSLTLV